MADINKLITDNIHVWTNSVQFGSNGGRGKSKKLTLHGVKKLRDLILELAVQGKLVTQDELDGSATESINKAKAEIAKKVINKEIKKPKKLPEISKEEKLFEVPRNWEWVRLGEIGLTNVGLTYSPKDVRDIGVPVLRSANIQKGKLDLQDLVRVNMVIKDSVLVKEGDLLICARNGSKALVGKTALLKNLQEKMAFGAFMAIFRSSFNEYFEVFINSPVYRRNLEGVGTTTINQITQNNLRLTLVPFPPEQEQKRIIAKVSELMALCDQLEQQTEASIDAHQLLVEQLLSTLTSCESAQEFEQNWARIAEHFDLLFTTEHSIEQLKQIILQLAVMGKLVPQDPTEEPASELLKRIAQEKEQLIKDKIIKKEKALPALTEEEKPFDLPSGWALARVGNLVSKLGSGSTPRGGKSAYVELGIPFLRSQNVWNDGIKTDDIAYIPEETHNNMSNTKVYPNDVLLNITGASLGRATIFPEELTEANVSQHVTIIRLIEHEMSEFVLLGIQSPMIQRLVWDRQVGVAIEGLSKKVLELFEFPIPPLPEQERIISKVRSLMALCEKLKANIIAANSTQIYLAETIVEKALGRNLVIKLEEKEENKAMKISTELSLGSVTYDKTAILAPLIGENGADAKSVWRKSGLKLPDFYRQLKSEITLGFVSKPAKAEFEG